MTNQNKNAVFDSKQLQDNLDLAAAKSQLLAASFKIASLQARIAEADEVLVFYGNPETYHAVGFAFDRPCGDFETDFSELPEHDFYDRPMPGKRAREILAKTPEQSLADIEASAVEKSRRVLTEDDVKKLWRQSLTRVEDMTITDVVGFANLIVEHVTGKQDEDQI